MIVCFYVPTIGLAVEFARKPDLASHPVALTQDKMLVAVSPKAERFGIKPGQKIPGALTLCSELTLLPYDREAYEAGIRPLWNLCAIESSVVEPQTPEICFVELSGCDQELRARMLLNAITARIPAAVYCGLAGAKFVAREAAIRQPPDRFLHVYFGTEKAFLENVLVPASMLDQKAVDRLERLGIRTLGDLRRLPPGELERQAKPYAARLRRLAIGIDSEAVRALWPQRMIEQKFDFDEEIVDSNRIEQALLRCSARISRMLGRDYGRTLRLVMHRTDRLKCCASERISAPINAAGDLYLVSLRLLKRLALTSAVTGLRLSIRDINIGSGMQLRLLDDNQAMGGLPNERQSALETTSGFLHARYGELAMTRAATFIKPEQIGLTLASLGRRLCVPVEVNCENGIPVSFLHHRCNYRITCVLDRWKLTECRGDTVCERNSFRVSYGRCAIADLEQSAAGWRLVGVGD